MTAPRIAPALTALHDVATERAWPDGWHGGTAVLAWQMGFAHALLLATLAPVDMTAFALTMTL